MKLPRWTVVTLLTTSALALFGFSAWWWVTWPERTAATFASLMAGERFDDAAPMASFAILLVAPKIGWNEPSLTAEPRTVVDTLYARQRFKVLVEGCAETGEPGAILTFIVQRGSVQKSGFRQIRIERSRN
jgi:hypothetical protein